MPVGWGGSGGSNEPPLLPKKVRFSGLRCIYLIAVYYHVPFNDLSCTTFTINRAKFRKRLPRTMVGGVALRYVLFSFQSARAHCSTVYC